MSRIAIDTTRVPAASAPLLGEIQSAFGVVPNMFKAVAHSPAALAMMWAGFGALGQGRIGAALGEQLAVAVANRNRCHYCLAAHTALGRKAGVTTEALARAQRGQSDDARTQAALAFALRVVDARGQVDAADVDALRRAGYDDGEVVEIVAHVALNLYTNYINNVLDVPVDFPRTALAA